MVIAIPIGTIHAFLLVLARVSGFLAFLPVPGLRSATDAVRVVLALSITFALFPVWPVLPATVPAISELASQAFCELGLGLAAGITVSLLLEGFQLAAQIAGLQAGYGYASTVDPSSEADSGVLQVVASLATSIFFFTTGLDHQFIRVLSASFEKFPAGSWPPAPPGLEASVIGLGAAMLSTGLRLALPIVALLLLIDLAIALVSRVQQQLQLLSLAFPGKMAAALALLAVLAPVVPKILASEANRTLALLWRALGY